MLSLMNNSQLFTGLVTSFAGPFVPDTFCRQTKNQLSGPTHTEKYVPKWPELVKPHLRETPASNPSSTLDPNILVEYLPSRPAGRKFSHQGSARSQRLMFSREIKPPQTTTFSRILGLNCQLVGQNRTQLGIFFATDHLFAAVNPSQINKAITTPMGKEFWKPRCFFKQRNAHPKKIRTEKRDGEKSTILKGRLLKCCFLKPGFEPRSGKHTAFYSKILQCRVTLH
ncbi:hypothetical protein AVEN_251213-1 [Araneus ventricosus]|uniref:Uncharacterized protein n=1 Tax=Araneus ventricosus TaxID=182803 RepID=A0A4Y2JEI7_ARAVE|nr:hypothetical protein AVEN_251213-1 [Araneus ventricosus]